MDVHILCTSITQFLNSAKLIGLPHFVKYLNYAGYIPHITHSVALKPLFLLNVSSVTRENYYTQHWNSTSTGTSVMAYQEAHGCEIQLQYPNKEISLTKDIILFEIECVPTPKTVYLRESCHFS